MSERLSASRTGRLTIADVARYPRPGMDAPAMLRFSPDSKCLHWLHADDGGLVRSLWRIDLSSGDRSVLAGPGAATPISREEELLRERTRTRELGVPSYAWARKSESPVLLIPGPTLRVSVNDEPLRALPDSAGALTPDLSPDGRQVAFVRGGELFVIDADGIDGKSAARQLTFDAEDGLTNGMPDYNAQEEFGLLRGHWWSEDRRLAYVRVDERHVPTYPIVHQGGGLPELETHRYPFAGEANPTVRLRVVDVDDGVVTDMPLPDEDGYLVRVAWWRGADGLQRLVAQWINRKQDQLRLLAFDDPHSPTTLIEEEQQPWINVADHATGLADGAFLWSSEASGFRHLSLRDASGGEIRRLTDGEWQVDSLIDVDQPGRLVYFTSTRGSALERRVERVSLDSGEIETLSEPGGMHHATLSGDGRWLAEMSSSLTDAPSISLLNLETLERQTLYRSDARLDGLALDPPQLRTFAAANGETLYGALYRPTGAGPHPLLLAVYGGPHAQTVLDAWGLSVDLRAQYLAQQGFLVLKLDNRGMAGRGLAFEAHLHRQMGTIEVDDQSAAVEQLIDEGLVDRDRVGVYGWSYGGYMTVMSMLRRPDLFKVGVAGAPVSDWDGYDTGYTERYMGTPQENAEGYREGSLLTHADQLRGRLLLVHGGVDENVHFRHTARLITALIEHDHDYDLLLFPQERHMPRDQAGLEYQEGRVARYFQRHL